MANGEKPSGGARETRLKSRIDRSAGGRRGDDAAIGRQPARDIVDTADGVARDRPGNRESVAPRGQGGASGRHFFLLRQRNLGEPIRPLGSGSAFNRRSASRRTRLSRSTARTCRRNLGRWTTPRVPRDASARVLVCERLSQVRDDYQTRFGRSVTKYTESTKQVFQNIDFDRRSETRVNRRRWRPRVKALAASCCQKSRVYSRV